MSEKINSSFWLLESISFCQHCWTRTIYWIVCLPCCFSPENGNEKFITRISYLSHCLSHLSVEFALEFIALLGSLWAALEFLEINCRVVKIDGFFRILLQIRLRRRSFALFVIFSFARRRSVIRLILLGQCFVNGVSYFPQFLFNGRNV